jgi:hypothetical protein
MKHYPLVLIIGLVATLGACTESDRMPGGGTDAGPIEIDSGVGADSGPGVDGAVAMCSAATGPYGTSVGRKLEPFTLQNCADGSDYAFYNEEWCEHSFTVISIGAGWCPPCIVESRELTARVTEAYRDQGVRVIQILIQDADYRQPTLEYCAGWVDRFGLTNVELIDPEQITQIYFPGNSLPSTIIVDSEGVIRFRENGATEGLVSLTNKLDELLAEM